MERIEELAALARCLRELHTAWESLHEPRHTLIGGHEIVRAMDSAALRMRQIIEREPDSEAEAGRRIAERGV